MESGQVARARRDEMKFTKMLCNADILKVASQLVITPKKKIEKVN